MKRMYMGIDGGKLSYVHLLSVRDTRGGENKQMGTLA
jgi:hypothetical protein